ncbi:sensor histidine kinase [Camelliibacillus cellulosilyticus]|uniref:histidine kinase n=2 Tax=Camelliibacillus cellulosilyticus TaxID=2174486 RepID=A0ABV9GPJ3_9BACL
MEYDLILFIKRFGASIIFIVLTLIQTLFLFKRVNEPDKLIEEWHKSMLYRSFAMLRDYFYHFGLGFQILFFIGIIGASGFGIAIVIAEPATFPIYVLLFIIFTLPTLFIFIKQIGNFNRLVNYTSDLVNGHADQDLVIKGKSIVAKLAGHINTLKHGVSHLQKEQAKSERLKTELITNVSHDLRTPLTSIITYSELLKTPNLSDEDREAYLEIIDRKSKRLKVLIDDLFEASKMASGAIELVKEKIDVVQLLQQALAENDETIQGSNLQLRVTTPEQPVTAIVDGQKLWRVFDNLIGNILKYSLEKTRVYISVKTEQERTVITFKNVSKYELSENIDELFERFKRGDTSRHTDGSGLGLAIAKSIIDLHDGIMDIDVDGDLFKVTVILK